MKLPKFLQRKGTIGEATFKTMGQVERHMDDVESYIKHGYKSNPTIYRCVQLIAQNAASVPMRLKSGDEYIEEHPLLDLLDQPNPDQGGVEYRTSAFSWLLLTGNEFEEKVRTIGNEVTQLWLWDPVKMGAKRIKGEYLPAYYEYGQNRKRWDVDQITGECDLLHWRMFSASDKIMGQAPLEAGSLAGDQLNAGSKWNLTALQNNCNPSLALYSKEGWSVGQRKEIQDALDKKSGAGKNDQTILLGGGMEIEKLSMNPQEMSWLEGIKHNEQLIASIFGVPTQLLGIEGSQTFANYEQARMAFWVDTVMPLVDLYVSELNRWLAPEFGEGLEICYDQNDIEALEPMRQQTLDMKLQSTVLTINEKRELLGYDRVEEPDADAVFMPISSIPLGFDPFAEGERQVAEVAEKMRAMGMSQQEAEVKAYEIWRERAKL